MISVILLVSFFALIVVGLPMGVALGTSTIIGLLATNFSPLVMVGKTAFDGVYSYSLLALPFYIFAGYIMSSGGIAEKLIKLAHSFVAKITGGLAMVTVMACAFFAAISGSSTATTAAIGAMMVPDMEKAGYDKNYSLAVAAAGGVIGPIIPPSISFVLYGVATETSVGDLFIAGIVPGILLAIALMIVVYFTCKKAGMKGSETEKRGLRGIAKAVWEAKWAVLLPIIILGGIYGGFCTPTEAGAVASVYAIVVSMFITRTLTVRGLIDALIESTLTSGVILFMVSTATIFGRILTLAQTPQQLASAIIGIAGSKFVALLLINVLLLIVGCLMEASAAIIILSPLLLPVVASFGISPIQFGVILVLNMCIGAITPPVGCCLYTACTIGNVGMEKIVPKVIPFFLAELAVLALVCVIPGLSTGLVSLLR